MSRGSFCGRIRQDGTVKMPIFPVFCALLIERQPQHTPIQGAKWWLPVQLTASEFTNNIILDQGKFGYAGHHYFSWTESKKPKCLLTKSNAAGSPIFLPPRISELKKLK